MRWFRADLHIHTVLSPCGGLDMSPINIVKQAIAKKLDIIAITDHNSTRHCVLAQHIGDKLGITVIAGVELNTREEIHCLAFFENIVEAERFQQYIDDNLTVIPNKPSVFGYQYVVDEDENILAEEERLLVAALQTGIEDVEREVHLLNGLFVPAHINRKQNGIYSQLGFLPAGLKADAMEVSCKTGYEDFLREHQETSSYSLLCSSDAHSLGQIGASVTEFYLQRPCFEEIRKAMKGHERQKIKSL